jgi:hypothetical protein
MGPRFFRSVAGAYLGSFDGVEPPESAIEVPSAPANARATWNGTGWTEPAPDPVLIPLAAVLTRVIVLGKLNDLLAVLQAEPSAAALLLSLKEGVFADDAQAVAVLTAAGVDAEVVLAP